MYAYKDLYEGVGVKWKGQTIDSTEIQYPNKHYYMQYYAGGSQRKTSLNQRDGNANLKYSITGVVSQKYLFHDVFINVNCR